MGNYSDAMEYIQKGLVNRVNGSTLMNENSSRSHSILIVTAKRKTEISVF